MKEAKLSLNRIAERVKPTESDLKRFFARVSKSDGCWIWRGITDEDGYGKIWYHGRPTISAHRLSYIIHKGEIPNGLFVLHNCPSGDNPSCVNPDHLFLGTNLENIQDRSNKGRSALGDRNGSRLHPERMKRGDDHPRRIAPWKWPVGEKSGRAVATEVDVREIRRLHKEGIPRRVIVAMFPYKLGTVKAIIARESWMHLP